MQRVSGASQMRDPGFLGSENNRGPGSAAHHFVLRCARDTEQRGETIMFTRREFTVGTGAVLTSTALTRKASAAMSLDLATVWPDGNFHTTNAKRFAEEVGKATGGEIKI